MGLGGKKSCSYKREGEREIERGRDKERERGKDLGNEKGRA
jgi:hypothetical protein